MWAFKHPHLVPVLTVLWALLLCMRSSAQSQSWKPVATYQELKMAVEDEVSHIQITDHITVDKPIIMKSAIKTITVRAPHSYSILRAFNVCV
jgi:hypothetical protein